MRREADVVQGISGEVALGRRMLVESVAQLAMLFGSFAWLHVIKVVEPLMSASPGGPALESTAAAPWHLLTR